MRDESIGNFTTDAYTASIDEFNHYTMTYNNSTKDFKFYVDSSLIGTVNYTAVYNQFYNPGSSTSYYGRLRLAQDYDEGNGGPVENRRRTQNISIGNIRYYSRELSSDEVEQNYLAEVGRYQ
jgi:hypothetical protein